MTSALTKKDWLAEPGHHLIEKESEDFPAFLSQISDPPEQLFVIGNVDALHMPALAIVGSRNPTEQGRQNAYEFAKHLGRSGFCIVSGLAQGIDAAAHEGALAAQAMTVAFLGHGIDQVYPAVNQPLAKRIAANNGAVCTEFPLGTPPRRENFPQRNRLISGLSMGTLVVEAASRSGSLISARLASEQGREIFAIPGSIHNPLSRGCHKLIRQGAKLVESAEDIVSELGPIIEHMAQMPDRPETPGSVASAPDTDYEMLLEAMAYDPVSADELTSRSGLTIEQVSSMLLILELEGKIEAQAGGHYSRLHR
ncbi:MAG: DNA-processing protein DprA [Gammaproteobacteria bacterium]|nr:DNA-processing protein DprA [Gammaproteobacteria bacterium]